MSQRPAADLMAEPGKFAPPPVTTDPATGAAAMSGADALPWAIDTLRLGGDIRARLIRLQDYVRTAVLGETSTPEPLSD
ncbi:hypothetical protein [Sphingomonas baiyangensis]|uniref:Uncharacterized protein n=1 Tax=Sphingomonas baiyangensis TaxID=2572576 RepID=A0A4U1L324_9SPHN|nr:hypothetical protein [Sphingomonas baiyangensis]TKD50593.1 hypothetical protein FBR43_07305 [Sphingomonas baiyangensis]